MLHTACDKRRKVFLRSCNMADVATLWETSKPSEANAALHFETHLNYDRQLAQRSRWMGGVSPSELEAIVSKGWAEGAQRVRALADSFRDKLPHPTSIRRRKVWTDQGDELDRDKVYSGQLDTAWRRTVRQEMNAQQVVSVVLPWAHYCNVLAEDLFWAGAAMLALTDVLEDAGYSVELLGLNAVSPHATMSRRGRRDNRADQWLTAVQVTVKAAGEPLRMDSVAALLCHAGTYRYYGICSVGGFPAYIGGLGWGTVPSTESAVDRLVDAGMMERPTIVGKHIYSEFAARAVIEQVIQQLQPTTTTV